MGTGSPAPQVFESNPFRMLTVISQMNTRWRPGSVLVLETPEAGSALKKNFFSLSYLSTEKLAGKFVQCGLWGSDLNCPALCVMCLQQSCV